MKEPEEVARQVIEGATSEGFLILTDEIAQTWMNRKILDFDRWPGGMRRIPAELESAE